jgi:hypothetical protein
VEDDDGQEEGEEAGNQVASGSTAKGHKKITSQAKASGRQQEPHRLDWIVYFHCLLCKFYAIYLFSTQFVGSLVGF